MAINTDSSNKAERFWDKTARIYDRVEKRDETTYTKTIEKSRKFLKSNDIVLDFGCGTGLVSNEIAGNVKMVYAIDISSKMLEIATEKAIRGKIQNIEYVQTTIFDERFKQDSIDVIIVLYILHLLDDPQKVIQRFYELLKPGGIVISVTPCMGEKPFFNSLLSIGSKIGIAPEIISFKANELENLFLKGSFKTIETGNLKKNSPEYLLIAKKP